MAKTLYQTLGLSKDAQNEDIRSAYRVLAKKYHPDRNPGDKLAEENFKRVSAAFDILGDKEKRRRYDRGEIDGEGKERYTQSASGAAPGFGSGAGSYASARRYAEGDAYDIGSIFSDLFGASAGRSRPPIRGADARYRLEIELSEAVHGVRKRVVMPDGHHLEVAIPEGVRDGQALRLKGKGGAGSFGGAAGDIYVDIQVRTHSFFKVEGCNISLELPISLKEALLGAQIPIPSLDGSILLKIPPGTDSGIKLRVKGRGLRDSKTGQVGDQIVTTRVLLPKNKSDELEKIVAELDDMAALEERRIFERDK